MPVYWITTYAEVRDAARLTDYAALAGTAIEAAGGRFLARGEPLLVLEGGPAPRSTLIEFDDTATALAAYESEGYQAALRVLGDAATRDIRVIGL